MRIFTRLILGIFIMLQGIAHATPSDDLSNLLNNVKTMRAGFSQTVYNDRGKPAPSSYGRMAMERPGKFRWEVQKPIPQLIIANDTRLWIYDPDLQQVTIRALHRATGDAPALLLSNVGHSLDKEYNVKSITKKPDTWQWFQLIPRAQDSMFASIQMGFNNGQIQEMHLQDHIGHTTQIKFKNIEMNIPLTATLFTYKAPRNVDVIDETQRKK